MHPQPPELEQLEALVWRLRGRSAHRILLVCSCWPDEGKSTVALQLSRLLVRAGSRVLLVDGDSRRPTLSHLLDTPETGLDAYLAGTHTAVPALEDGLDLLSAPRPGGVLLSPDGTERERFRAQVNGYQHVLLDSPPLSACSDALTLAGLCDAGLLVVSGRTYHGPEEARLVRELQAVGLPLEGVVLTNDRDSGSARLPSAWSDRFLVWLGLKR